MVLAPSGVRDDLGFAGIGADARDRRVHDAHERHVGRREHELAEVEDPHEALRAVEHVQVVDRVLRRAAHAREGFAGVEVDGQREHRRIDERSGRAFGIRDEHAQRRGEDPRRGFVEDVFGRRFRQAPQERRGVIDRKLREDERGELRRHLCDAIRADGDDHAPEGRGGVHDRELREEAGGLRRREPLQDARGVDRMRVHELQAQRLGGPHHSSASITAGRSLNSFAGMTTWPEGVASRTAVAVISTMRPWTSPMRML